jgi:hypothetical protein
MAAAVKMVLCFSTLELSAQSPTEKRLQGCKRAAIFYNLPAMVSARVW